MKVVIDIPTKTLEYYIRLCDKGEPMNNIEEIAASGTPLEKVLEDIKAEIIHLTCKQYNRRLTLDREEVLEIIDRYKEESE